jgi:hypothetical protein
VPPLIEALQDKEAGEKAAAALTLITGRNFGRDTEKWQAWWDKNRGEKSGL